jgi:hypothetical protein
MRTMKTKKKIGWLRRVDDRKLFKFWRLTGVDVEPDGQRSPAKIMETDLGEMESADGRRIYTADYAEFFFEGEPKRPLRIASMHGA